MAIVVVEGGMVYIMMERSATEKAESQKKIILILMVKSLASVNVVSYFELIGRVGVRYSFIM
jgi:hypothetical protein